jgi:hypothetical protein
VRRGVGGVWVAPEDQAIVADAVQLQARINPVGTGTPGAIGVDFVAAAASATPAVVCSATFPDADGVYGCMWSPAAAGAPSGEIQISFDVNDQSGQVNRSANGTRVILYVPATLTPSAQPTQRPVATLEVPTIMATTVSASPAEEVPAPTGSALPQESEPDLLEPEATLSSDAASE